MARAGVGVGKYSRKAIDFFFNRGTAIMRGNTVIRRQSFTVQRMPTLSREKKVT